MQMQITISNRRPEPTAEPLNYKQTRERLVPGLAVPPSSYVTSQGDQNRANCACEEEAVAYLEPEPGDACSRGSPPVGTAPSPVAEVTVHRCPPAPAASTCARPARHALPSFTSLTAALPPEPPAASRDGAARGRVFCKRTSHLAVESSWNPALSLAREPHQ